jgi:hypothetical protein
MRSVIATARVVGWLAGMGGVLACTAGSSGEDPFNSPTGAQPGSVSVSAGDGDDDDGDESSTGDGSSEGDDAPASTGSDDAVPGTETGEPEATGAPVDPPDTDGTDGGVPPAMGMYSECLVPEECLAPINVCIVVNDTEGFCTNMACTNPATDCEPSPGGTATPICFPIELNGMPTASCALGCAGGLTCPAGMTCWPLAEGSICA